ncbi:hypothetical protein D3C76_1821040 [compost metagenome]
MDELESVDVVDGRAEIVVACRVKLLTVARLFPVGASMLAMDDETPLGIRQPALTLTTIASMLAPAGTASERSYTL